MAQFKIVVDDTPYGVDPAFGNSFELIEEHLDLDMAWADADERFGPAVISVREICDNPHADEPPEDDELPF